MDLLGFKSFAEKTSLAFEPGITIVVGPNGCGKSNVVDSIKWVLGEKQAKNIRGEKMEDVIFSGTENRKPLSLAEVSITLDNSGRILGLDSDAVTVSRRVFRDGESEYLINKSPVRLKDIEQLFMDTGIGKSSYSVMEQGKIDLILSSRAEDRRYMFEEAAGISRFKYQKKESLRKLEETGHNLERINDIIKEIEREKDLKAKQAEKTKIYLGLLAEYKQHDVRLNLIKYADIKKRRKKLWVESEKLRKEREEMSARVSRIDAENEKDEKNRNDIQLQLFELDKKLHTCRIKSEDIDVRTDKNRRLIEEQESRRAAVEKSLKDRSEGLSRLADEKRKNERAGVEMARRIKEDRERLEGVLDMRRRKIQSIRTARENIEAHRRGIKSDEQALRGLRESLETVIKRLVDAIDKRKAELAGSEQERREVRARIDDRLKAFEEALRDARRHLAGAAADRALEALRAIDVEGLRRDIGLFESYEDGFRSILFDRTGIHAQKEDLDGKIRDTAASMDAHNAAIALLDAGIQNDQAELEEVNAMVTKIEKDLSRNENENAWIEKHLKSLDHQVMDLERQIEAYREETARIARSVDSFRGEIKEWENRLVEFSDASESLKKNISEFTAKRDDIERTIVSRKNLSRKDAENMKRLQEKLGECDKHLVELDFKATNIEEYLWTEYEKKVGEVKGADLDEGQIAGVQASIQDLKKRIQELGPVNNLAIDEYRELKKRFEYYIGQKSDIEKARQDILSVIEDINKTSLELFMSTFTDIQKNFAEVFRQLFEGGTAALELTEPGNVLESGIEIFVRPPGKKLKNINLLSGGERALTAIALLFATYMVKPSPFCFLDEIDAPLDEENIGRFVRMLQQFSKNSQFVIVTHNKKTMSIGQTIYGVTMEEPGVSKVVSLRMEKAQKKAV